MYLFVLLIVSTTFTKVVYGDSFDCISYVYMDDGSIYISTLNFPATVDWENRSKCHFEFKSRSGNFVLIITNGYLNNVVITWDKEIRFYDEIDTNKDYYQFIGKSISFKLLTNNSKSGNKTVWQAFQGYIYYADPFSSGQEYYIYFLNNSDSDDSKMDLLVPLTSEIVHRCNWYFYFNVSDTYLKMSLNLNMADSSSVLSTYPDIGINLIGPYSTNGTELFQIPGIYRIFTILYTNLMQTGNYGNLRGLVSLAQRDNGVVTNCTFYNNTENTFVFSSFDMIHGYKNNAHCLQWITVRQGSQLAFWFQTFHLEEAYDNVTVRNNVTFDVIKILPGHIYLAPSYDILFKFDSDGSITQAGFKIFIQEYDCSFGNITVIIPCSGTVNVTALGNFTNPHIFCSYKETFINYQIEEECSNEAQLISMHYNIVQTTMIYGYVESPDGSEYPLNWKRRVIPKNFSIAVASDLFYNILDTTDIWYFLTLQQLSQPKLIDTLILNETTTYIIYDLSKISNNSYLEILNNSSKNTSIDFFFVTDSDYGVLDFYEGFFGTYIIPLEYMKDFPNGITIRRFMPIGYSLSDYRHLIYSEEGNKNYSAFVFIKTHDIDTSNCLFEHTVIDAKLLATMDGELTMVNNGTATCTVFLLNPFNEKRLYLDDFWTDSASDPIEFHDEKEMLFNFTKFDKIGQFFLETNFYRFILPPRTSFTVTGHENKLN